MASDFYKFDFGLWGDDEAPSPMMSDILKQRLADEKAEHAQEAARQEAERRQKHPVITSMFDILSGGRPGDRETEQGGWLDNIEKGAINSYESTFDPMMETLSFPKQGLDLGIRKGVEHGIIPQDLAPKEGNESGQLIWNTTPGKLVESVMPEDHKARIAQARKDYPGLAETEGFLNTTAEAGSGMLADPNTYLLNTAPGAMFAPGMIDQVVQGVEQGGGEGYANAAMGLGGLGMIGSHYAGEVPNPFKKDYRTILAYHGSPQAFENFDPSIFREGLLGKVPYGTPDAEIAKTYALGKQSLNSEPMPGTNPNSYQFEIRTKNPFEHNAPASPEMVKQFIDYAREQGVPESAVRELYLGNEGPSGEITQGDLYNDTAQLLSNIGFEAPFSDPNFNVEAQSNIGTEYANNYLRSLGYDAHTGFTHHGHGNGGFEVVAPLGENYRLLGREDFRSGQTVPLDKRGFFSRLFDTDLEMSPSGRLNPNPEMGAIRVGDRPERKQERGAIEFGGKKPSKEPGYASNADEVLADLGEEFDPFRDSPPEPSRVPLTAKEKRNLQQAPEMPVKVDELFDPETGEVLGEGETEQPPQKQRGPTHPPEIPAEGDTAFEPPEEEPVAFRVKLDNGEIYKTKGTDHESVLEEVNARLAERGYTAKAVEAEAVKDPLARAAEAEPSFEDAAKRIKRDTERVEAQVAREQQRAEAQGFKEQVSLGNKIEKQQGVEAARAAKQQLASDAATNRAREAAEAKATREAIRVEEKASKIPHRVELDNGKYINVQASSPEAAVKTANRMLESRGLPARAKTAMNAKEATLRKAGEGSKAGLAAKGVDEGSEFTKSPIVKSLNTIKSIAYGGDFGHLLRQGKQMTTDLLFSKHAAQAFKQFPETFKAMRSEENFTKFHDRIYADPEIKMMVDDFGADLPGLGKNLKEEAFHGGGALDKVPVVGSVMKASERAYTAGLNFLRQASLKKGIESLKASGFTPENAPEKYRSLARGINIISQRGDFSPAYQKVFSDASAIFGSPRAKASRIQQLGEMLKGTESGKIARRSFAKTVAFNAGLFGILKAKYGDDLEFVTDPERTDFMKIRKGDVTVDPWIGLGPTFRTMMKLYYGKTKSPYTKKYTRVAPTEAIGKELVNGLAPGIAMIWEGATGTDTQGFLKPRVEALENAAPMTFRQMKDIIDSEGVDGMLLNLMQYAGEGVDVFNYKKAREKQNALKREKKGSAFSGIYGNPYVEDGL